MTDPVGAVGLIGLGQMGGAMCRNLLRGGWHVVAWDVWRPAVEAAVQAGADAASDPRDVASRTHIIVTSLPDAEAVRAVAFGHRGIVRSNCEGRLVVDTSTIKPVEARGLAADLAAYRVGFVDAPVSGGVGGAEEGRLSVMVGGPAEQFDRARAVLQGIGKVVVHCGPAGAGQVAKACNQLVVMATLETVAEVLVLAQASGLDPWQAREVLLGGYAASPILEIQGSRMLRRDFAPGGKARYHLKDIATIEELAREAGLDLPGFKVAACQIERLIGAGGADLDHSALITVVEPGAPRPSPAQSD